ncbi:MAG: hypothetical protein HXO24_03115 [Prevotella sp.]|nr:hypothetical protein [Prevotella sp.]
MGIDKNAIARRRKGWWQMGNVMDNHLNIERNIGGGSARNFNQKKVFGETLAEYFLYWKDGENGYRQHIK